MADLITGDTELAATKQDMIAEVVQRELIDASNLAGTIRDVSAFARPGNRSISFPKGDSFTVINRASGAAGDASQITYGNDKLDLDINAYLAWILDKQDVIESNIEAELDNAQRAARAMGKYVDTQIIAELETVGVAATAGAISRDVILEMRRDLCKRQGRLSEMTLAIGCDDEEALLKISQFSDADVFGRPVVEDGSLRKLYGVQVIVNTQLASGAFYMYDSEGCALGFQQRPEMGSQSANEYGVGSQRVAMDQKFGVKGLQIEQAGVAAGFSALVMKDGN